jgi:hypothetical protein
MSSTIHALEDAKAIVRQAIEDRKKGVRYDEAKVRRLEAAAEWVQGDRYIPIGSSLMFEGVDLWELYYWYDAGLCSDLALPEDYYAARVPSVEGLAFAAATIVFADHGDLTGAPAGYRARWTGGSDSWDNLEWTGVFVDLSTDRTFGTWTVRQVQTSTGRKFRVWAFGKEVRRG